MRKYWRENSYYWGDLMPQVKLTAIDRFLRCRIQHYDPIKYWKYRADVISCGGGYIRTLICRVKLLYIKRCDAFNNATLGTHLGFGATFADVPNFPHGLYGIVVSHNAVIGKNVTIYHQVTIGEGQGGAPSIGNDVMIGAGAKIIGNIKVGNGAKIGAGCVVRKDIPEGAIVVPPEPNVIIRDMN